MYRFYVILYNMMFVIQNKNIISKIRIINRKQLNNEKLNAFLMSLFITKLYR